MLSPACSSMSSPVEAPRSPQQAGRQDGTPGCSPQGLQPGPGLAQQLPEESLPKKKAELVNDWNIPNIDRTQVLPLPNHKWLLFPLQPGSMSLRGSRDFGARHTPSWTPPVGQLRHPPWASFHLIKMGRVSSSPLWLLWDFHHTVSCSEGVQTSHCHPDLQSTPGQPWGPSHCPASLGLPWDLACLFLELSLPAPATTHHLLPGHSGPLGSV